MWIYDYFRAIVHNVAKIYGALMLYCILRIQLFLLLINLFLIFSYLDSASSSLQLCAAATPPSTQHADNLVDVSSVSIQLKMKLGRDDSAIQWRETRLSRSCFRYSLPLFTFLAAYNGSITDTI